MDIGNIMKMLDEKFITNLEAIVNSYRDKEVETEFSYDIEECETFGEFFDLMIESEICEIYESKECEVILTVAQIGFLKAYYL